MLKPLKSLFKKSLKNRSIFAVIFERFFKQDLSSFWAGFERSYKKTDQNHQKAWKGNVTLRCSCNTIYNLKNVLNRS